MGKSYGKEIVRVITDKQEIEKNYSINVAQVQGFIHLDMDDFYAFANKYKLVMEIFVDSPASLSDQIKTAVSEIKKHGIGKVSAMMLSISYKPSSPLVMGELRCLDDLIDYKEIKFKRGIQENDNIFNYRSISLFVFEQKPIMPLFGRSCLYLCNQKLTMIVFVAESERTHSYYIDKFKIQYNEKDTERNQKTGESPAAE